MIDKSKLRELLVIVCFVLIISLVLLVIFLYRSLFDKKDVPKKAKSEVITKTYNLEDIEYLKFDFRNSKVYYESTSKSNLIIKQYGKTNRFLINRTKSYNSISFRELHSNMILKTTYKIYIPKDYINNIDITNGFGNIKIGNFSNNIKIDNNSGNVVIGKLDNLDIKSVSGNINIKKVSTKFNASSSTGNIMIDSLEGNASIDTITGDITINKFLILDKSYIETTSGNINIKVNKKSQCNLVLNSDNQYNKVSKKVCLNGENILKVKNVTGQVTIK